MRILLLAPRADGLPWAEAEVQAIDRTPGLTVTLRIGTVNHADVLNDVIAGRYDGLWFAGHATAGGLLLTDGVLQNEEIVPLIRGRFQWVFLNTCESQATARMIWRETGTAVVATILEVPDRLAFQTGALFAQALAETKDVAAAYAQSRPGGSRVYVYEAGTVKKKCRTMKPSSATWSGYSA